MAKKNTNKGAAQRKAEAIKTVKAAPVKPQIKEIKPVKKQIERLTGDHLVNFVSNGLSKYMRRAGKIHLIPAEHAQLLIDKGYGHVAR